METYDRAFQIYVALLQGHYQRHGNVTYRRAQLALVAINSAEIFDEAFGVRQGVQGLEDRVRAKARGDAASLLGDPGAGEEKTAGYVNPHADPQA